MKTHIIWSFLVGLTGLLVTSCQEEKVVDETTESFTNSSLQYTPQQITNASYKQQKMYAQHHLHMLNQSLLGVVDNRTFRTILYSEVEKKTTGESAALLSELFKRIYKEVPSLLNTMNEKISAESMANSQGAFWGIEGKVLFPQVYIPFFEESAPATTEARLTNGDVPVIVTDPISNEDVLTGYTIDKQGEIIEVSGIDEAFAREREVWVVSLNERVEAASGQNDSCKFPFLCYPKPQSQAYREQEHTPAARSSSTQGTCTSDGNPSIPKYSEKGIDVFVNKLTAKTHKEPWHAGESEVNIAFTSLWGGGVNEFTGQKDEAASWTKAHFDFHRRHQSGMRIEEISRADVRRKRSKAVNRRIIVKWGEPGDERKDTVPFVVYEYDGWPSTATITTTTRTYGGQTIRYPNTNRFTFTVASRESTPYCNGYFNWYQGHYNYACGHGVSNSESAIDFYTRKPF